MRGDRVHRLTHHITQEGEAGRGSVGDIWQEEGRYGEVRTVLGV